MPVYYVIAEQQWSQPANMYGVCAILAVYECDLEDIGGIHARFVEPLAGQGRMVRTFIFSREPPNPLRSWSAQPAEQEQELERPGVLPGD